MARLISGKSWIEAYCDYITPYSSSPSEFHFWSAVTIIAASMKRHVWVDRGSWKLYPNLFTVMVGRPATGKGASINPAIAILKEAGTANILADRMTIEYVLEKLSTGFANHNISGGVLSAGTDATALILAPELSVFLRTNNEALGDLCQLWDSTSFDYATRHKGLYPIKDPGVSLLGGSAPKWLSKSIPDDAVGGGFTRRVNFVYTKQDPVFAPWEIVLNGNAKMTNLLVDDLKAIHSLTGEYKASAAFKVVFDTYMKGIKIEDFDDEATVAFKGSKWVNVVKLCMCIAAATRDSMVLEAEDFLLAFPLVDKVESDLALVFRSVGESDDVVSMALLMEFIEKRGYTTLSDIMSHLWRHISRDDALRIIITLKESNMIDEVAQGHKTVYKWLTAQPWKGRARP